IDECSMVDAELGRDLMSFGVPLLVLGDPAQLPPVSGGGFSDVMLRLSQVVIVRARRAHHLQTPTENSTAQPLKMSLLSPCTRRAHRSGVERFRDAGAMPSTPGP